ncbi:hypothetical protein JKP88DRAFT_224022 [Tribonema minus]|uniref:Uncharacterized protein n=1 Tax=Tribonema minus TaxID=303371 RepID=A0A835YQW8_9STRA|nr:hypothetical protein JKP88DRAFT_224022 [Tribonema minus]
MRRDASIGCVAERLSAAEAALPLLLVWARAVARVAKRAARHCSGCAHAALGNWPLFVHTCCVRALCIAAGVVEHLTTNR